ncbi:MAG: transcription antitermination factor NusB [Planctomycetes bacterium]|nr:transcription antitermination factor NusB [Planctomycetota bacterium]
MNRRSRAREVALQLLFQRDHNPFLDRPALVGFARNRLGEPALVEFCLQLYDGVLAHQEEIDQRLSASAENWRLPRMAAVDRNVLRVGAFEVLFFPETPSAVAFDEAIELARRYGTAESSAFVNGVLDRLRREATGETTAAEASAGETAGADTAAEPPTESAIPSS